jgi:hypothetical protein
MNVVRALEEAKGPEGDFDMSMFVHSCGTPACALGHYAARTDLQSEFQIVRDGMKFGDSYRPISDGYPHFGFQIYGPDYMSELFLMDGCGGAKTRAEAAAYIRDFIRRHGGVA